jgi:hypothetical protein
MMPSNIYLGHLESHFSSLPGILLFNRYVDDLLIISDLPEHHLMDYLHSLENAYQLHLTSSISNTSIVFLDMTLFISPSQHYIRVFPFGKSIPIYPIYPDYSRKNSNIINSQLLRTWRISNDNRSFSKSVNDYLKFIHNKRLRRNIFQFLGPIKLHTHQWSTEILLCASCINNSAEFHLQFHKIKMVNGKLLTTKQPLNCSTSNIFIIIEYSTHKFMLKEVPSLHYLLIKRRFHIDNALPILPYGQMKSSQLKNFLLAFPEIQYSLRPIILKKKDVFPCHIHDIFKDGSQYTVYQLLLKEKSKFATILTSISILYNIFHYLFSFKPFGRN